MKKKTKTERFLDLITILATSERGWIDDGQIREILGHPSKSQYHRYVNELTKESLGKKPLLRRVKTQNSFVYELYGLPSKGIAPESVENKPNVLLFKQNLIGEVKVYHPGHIGFENSNIAKDLVGEGDGYNLYKVRFENEDQFVDQMLPFGDDAMVLEPESVRRKLVTKAKRIADLNASPSEVLKKIA